MTRRMLVPAIAMLGWLAFSLQAGVAKAAESGQAIVAGDDPADIGPRVRAKSASPRTFPRTVDGHPDFNGIWFAGVKGFAALDDTAVAIPLTPEYQALRKRRIQAIVDGEPMADFVSTCQAFGMPRVMSYGNFEFALLRNQLLVVTEVLHEVRRIYLDGKAHGDLQDYSFGGVSVGHWEGDTLVVETHKLRAGYFDMSGAAHSDQLRVVERIRMINRNAIEDEMTLTDLVALERPWVVMQRFERRPQDFEIGEYICAENVRSGVDGPSPQSMLPKSATSASH